MACPSIGTYPPDWPEIARAVKEEACWRCIRCGHPHDPASGYTLTVHHLDYDKSNCRWHNLAALCQRCHLHIQAKVVMARVYLFEHTDWFKPYVAGYYAHQAGLPDDRAFVMAHLEQLQKPVSKSERERLTQKEPYRPRSAEEEPAQVEV